VFGRSAPILCGSFFLLLSIALVSSCTEDGSDEAEAPRAAIRLTDWLGRKVELAAPARRIVSLAPSNTEILFALEAGDRLVARDELSDYPPRAKRIPSLGNLYPKVEAEAIVLLAPDLVLAAGMTSPDDVKALARIGLVVYSTSIAAGLEDIYRDIAAIGALVGEVDRGRKLIRELQRRVENVRARTSREEKRKVFYEIDATDPSKPWTAGPQSFIDQLLSLAGGTNVASSGPDRYFQISLEELLSEDPTVIILGSSTYGGQTPEIVAARHGWRGIHAVRNGAVYVFDDKLVSRPGPRVVEGLEVLARLLHPAAFE
jgi:iron complex transport system substrate-binding protein